MVCERMLKYAEITNILAAVISRSVKAIVNIVAKSAMRVVKSRKVMKMPRKYEFFRTSRSSSFLAKLISLEKGFSQA